MALVGLLENLGLRGLQKPWQATMLQNVTSAAWEVRVSVVIASLGLRSDKRLGCWHVGQLDL